VLGSDLIDWTCEPYVNEGEQKDSWIVC
jgi:hypothetical protein